MSIGQEALELIREIKIAFRLLVSPRETGIMQAGLVLLKGAYRVVCQRSAAVSARILEFLRSKDHGAGDGFPQVFRVIGHAVRSYARFAAANPRLVVLLLIALVSLYALYENYKPPQIA
jgi:hypothetical protein